MRRLNIILSSAAVFLVLTGFGLFSLNVLGYTQVIKAEQRIDFIKLIEHESLSDSVLTALYMGLKADYCGLKADQSQLIFKYTLADEFGDKTRAIETLFTTTLKAQHDKFSLDMCQ